MPMSCSPLWPRWALLVLVLATVVPVTWARVTSARGEEEAKETPTGIAALAWLAGAWSSAAFETVYTSPRGGEILSASKFLQGERAVFFDYERFVQKGKDVVLTPFPGGRKSVEFLLTDFDPRVKKARFVNEKHDFPKTLTYERTGEKTLRITLTGNEQGVDKKMVLELTRS
jgi:hypothetical protein